MLECICLCLCVLYSGVEYGYYVGEFVLLMSALSGGEDVECDVLYSGCLFDVDEMSWVKLLKKYIM